MITINGNTLPNIPYFFTNLNLFSYSISGSYTRNYGPYTHVISGSTDDTGSFSVDLFPTDYHVQLGIRNRSFIYYKNLREGLDNSIIEFGDSNCYLSGTNWYSNIPDVSAE